MAELNNIQALTHALEVAMKKNPNIVIYGEDVGYEGGVFRATQGLQKIFGEKRVFDAPISEATFAGTAIGMAINGLYPIIEMQFSGFSLPALQEIFAHAARMRNRSRSRFTVPMMVRMTMGGGVKALEHHSEALEAMFAHVPGLVVMMPSTPYDVKGMLLAATESKDPIIFFEPTKIYRAFKMEVPDKYYTVPIGKGYLMNEGSDITVVTYGSQTVDCEEALELLKTNNKNISVDLIDLRTIQPWDKEMVINSVIKTGRLLVVHEAVQSFSVSAEIITTVTQKAFEHLKCPPDRVTGYDITVPFAAGEKYHMVTKEKIANKIIEMMEY